MNKISILGTIYTIEYKTEKEDKELEELEGYCKFHDKKIVIIKLKTREAFKNENKETIIKIQNKILRHEIIHAFIYESGLANNSNRSYNWAENEEMVDWFAIQSPKIIKVFKELKINE